MACDKKVLLLFLLWCAETTLCAASVSVYWRIDQRIIGISSIVLLCLTFIATFSQCLSGSCLNENAKRFKQFSIISQSVPQLWMGLYVLVSTCPTPNDARIVGCIIFTFLSSLFGVYAFQGEFEGEDYEKVSDLVPLTLFKMGFFIARIFSLVYASFHYGYWIFLILALHGIVVSISRSYLENRGDGRFTFLFSSLFLLFTWYSGCNWLKNLCNARNFFIENMVMTTLSVYSGRTSECSLVLLDTWFIFSINAVPLVAFCIYIFPKLKKDMKAEERAGAGTTGVEMTPQIAAVPSPQNQQEYVTSQVEDSFPPSLNKGRRPSYSITGDNDHPGLAHETFELTKSDIVLEF